MGYTPRVGDTARSWQPGDEVTVIASDRRPLRVVDGTEDVYGAMLVLDATGKFLLVDAASCEKVEPPQPIPERWIVFETDDALPGEVFCYAYADRPDDPARLPVMMHCWDEGGVPHVEIIHD